MQPPPPACAYYLMMISFFIHLSWTSAHQLMGGAAQQAKNFLEFEDREFNKFKAIVDPLNTFSISLMVNHSDSLPHTSSAVSSVSIAAMIYALLRAADGTTANQVIHSLGLEPGEGIQPQDLLFDLLDSPFDDRANIALATYLMLRQQKSDKDNKDLKKYQKDVSRVEITALETIDKFHDAKTPQKVNEWFKKNTGGHLYWMLTNRLFYNHSLVVMNGVYHKIKWQYPFDVNLTEKGTFYDGKHPNGKKNTDFMIMRKARLPFADVTVGDTYTEVLDLPLSSKRLSMILLIPHSMVSFKKAVSKRGSEEQLKLLNIMHRMQNYVPNGNVNIRLPKFFVNNTVDIYSGFRDIGISELFSARKADLTRIRGQEFDYVSLMRHRTFVRVEEFGSNGQIVVDPSMENDKQYTFDATHPFAFFVMDKTTGLIVLNGIVENPEQ